MTYGRPSMTAHLPGLPLPSTAELDNVDDAACPTTESTNAANNPSKMTFYVQYIRQCRILGDILSNVYQSSQSGRTDSNLEYHGLDAILQLDAKLSRYEIELDPILSWKSSSDLTDLSPDTRSVIATQRTVLHGR